MAFLKLPNHSSTRWMPCWRALAITLSSSAKSKWPSVGSIISHVTLPSSVLTCMSRMFCHTVCMYSALLRLLLCSSPPRHRYGLPLTTSCEDVWVFRKCGISWLVVIAGTGVEREYLGSSGEDIAVCATISNEENKQQDSVGKSQLRGKRWKN